MQKFPQYLVFATAVVVASGAASQAAAQNLKLTMANGRVNLVAHEVPLRQILAEWARVGDTQIVNADKLIGPPLTLELVDCPEGRALDMLLRQAAGYLAAPRPANQPGPSIYDRIMILATSRPPVVTASAPPPPFNRTLMPQPMPVPVEDDNGEPGEQGPVAPPGVVPPGMPVPGQQPVPSPLPQGTQQQPVMTAPRPGPLPQPQPAPQPQGVNPYLPGAGPGAGRPPVPPGRPGGGPGSN